MSNNNRKELINQVIQKQGELKISELSDMFSDVSTMTIRRDLDQLQEEGSIVRTWGGAKSINHLTNNESEEGHYQSRVTENVESKIKIAEKALKLMEPKRSIFFDSGTTIMCLAEILDDKNYSILTSGPNIALEIIKNNRPSVNLIGGQVDRTNITVKGANSIEFIKNINIDIAFMSTSGFSLNSGFTISILDEMELKSKIISKASKVIMLMDSSKLGKNMTFTFAEIEDIDILVTAI